MAKRQTKQEKIQIYVKNNRDEIVRKMEKTRYDNFEKQYGFEDKIKALIPCNDCLVRPACAEKFLTKWLPYSIECEILQTFIESVEWVLKHGGYKESSEYRQRIVRYVKKQVREGKIKL